MPENENPLNEKFDRIKLPESFLNDLRQLKPSDLDPSFPDFINPKIRPLEAARLEVVPRPDSANSEGFTFDLQDGYTRFLLESLLGSSASRLFARQPTPADLIARAQNAPRRPDGQIANEVLTPGEFQQVLESLCGPVLDVSGPASRLDLNLRAQAFRSGFPELAKPNGAPNLPGMVFAAHQEQVMASFMDIVAQATQHAASATSSPAHQTVKLLNRSLQAELALGEINFQSNVPEKSSSLQKPKKNARQRLARVKGEWNKALNTLSRDSRFDPPIDHQMPRLVEGIIADPELWQTFDDRIHKLSPLGPWEGMPKTERVVIVGAGPAAAYLAGTIGALLGNNLEVITANQRLGDHLEANTPINSSSGEKNGGLRVPFNRETTTTPTGSPLWSGILPQLGAALEAKPFTVKCDDGTDRTYVTRRTWGKVAEATLVMSVPPEHIRRGMTWEPELTTINTNGTVTSGWRAEDGTTHYRTDKQLIVTTGPGEYTSKIDPTRVILDSVAVNNDAQSGKLPDLKGKCIDPLTFDSMVTRQAQSELGDIFGQVKEIVVIGAGDTALNAAQLATRLNIPLTMYGIDEQRLAAVRPRYRGIAAIATSEKVTEVASYKTSTGSLTIIDYLNGFALYPDTLVVDATGLDPTPLYNRLPRELQATVREALDAEGLVVGRSAGPERQISFLGTAARLKREELPRGFQEAVGLFNKETPVAAWIWGALADRFGLDFIIERPDLWDRQHVDTLFEMVDENLING